MKTFKDLRGREWELFSDASYYDMICVRVKDDKNFNSETSFHFSTYNEANDFKELIKISR